MHSTILGDDSQFYKFDVCKGAWVILLNGFVRGGSFASKELIEIMVKWINGTSKEDVKIEYGTSPGMADAIPLMQMAYQILEDNDYKPKHGEGLALLSSNAFSMCEAALSIFQLKKLMKMSELGIALALLAENGNCSIVQDLGIKAAKHWDVKVETIKAVLDHLRGHPILNQNKDTLHSHLTLRSSCDILASAKEALNYGQEVLEQVLDELLVICIQN